MPRRALVALIATLVLAAAPAARACGSGAYSYAGLSSRDTVHGISATMTSLTAPAVQNGHVAGWVGVGGPGLGPHGSSEWIQVGYSGFPGLTVGSLYYEVALPGGNPTYHEVFSSIESGAQHRVAVLEVAHQDDWWRVWVDGHPINDAYHLPGSHGAWRGIATAENWGAGVRACNQYAYRFQDISTAGTAGGSWDELRTSYRMQQGENRLVMSSPSAFVARAGSLPTTTTLAARRSDAKKPVAVATKPKAAPKAKPSAASPKAVAAVSPITTVTSMPTPDTAPLSPVDAITQADALTSLGVTP